MFANKSAILIGLGQVGSARKRHSERRDMGAERIIGRNGLGCWFSCGTEPVFPPRSEPPLSIVF
jgi:hypothetical protein